MGEEILIVWDLLGAADDAGGIAHYNSERRHIARDDCAGANQGAAADAHPRQQDCACANFSLALGVHPFELIFGVRRVRVARICESNAWSYPALWLEDRALRDKCVRVNPHAVADLHVVLNDAVAADAHHVADMVVLADEGPVAGVKIIADDVAIVDHGVRTDDRASADHSRVLSFAPSARRFTDDNERPNSRPWANCRAEVNNAQG
jgi:hypothetical protein